MTPITQTIRLNGQDTLVFTDNVRIKFNDHSFLGFYTWTHKCWPTCKNLHSSALWRILNAIFTKYQQKVFMMIIYNCIYSLHNDNVTRRTMLVWHRIRQLYPQEKGKTPPSKNRSPVFGYRLYLVVRQQFGSPNLCR